MPARISTARPRLFPALARLGRPLLGGSLLLIALTLAACGSKGPLYLPGDPAENPPAGQAGEDAEQRERDR